MPALVKLPPRGYLQRQIFATFLDDPVGISNWSFVGCDNLFGRPTIRTLATWPHAREVFARDIEDGR